MGKFGVALVATIVVGGAIGFGVWRMGQPARDASRLEHEARQRVDAYLRDPAAAQLKDLARHEGAICGRVNARNGFGGYVGFRRFVAPDGLPPMFEPEVESPSDVNQFLFDSVARKWCPG